MQATSRQKKINGRVISFEMMWIRGIPNDGVKRLGSEVDRVGPKDILRYPLYSGGSFLQQFVFRNPHRPQI